MKTTDKVRSMPTDKAVMNKLRKQMRKVRSLERKLGREQKALDRDAYAWAALGY